MGLCSSVITPCIDLAVTQKRRKKRKLYMSRSSVGGFRRYQGPSPDEMALVEGARQLGFEFRGRTRTHITIAFLGHQVRPQPAGGPSLVTQQPIPWPPEAWRCSYSTPIPCIHLHCRTCGCALRNMSSIYNT